METWLGSILGVVVVGVVVELLTQNRRMGNFIRSIYGFIVLLVIISPLPKLLKADWWSMQIGELVDGNTVQSLSRYSKQTQIAKILQAKGYEDALVTVVDGDVYVNLGVTLDEKTFNELQKDLGEEVIIL